MSNSYTITDLEKLSGIKAHTLRIWEKRYSIVQPDRSNANNRRYSSEDMKRVINIAVLNKNGWRISKIAGLDSEQLRAEVRNISEEPSIAAKIEPLIIAMIDYNEERFCEIMNQVIDEYGFEACYEELIWPFLERIGVLWVTDSISIAHEHMISNMLRQKLVANIDALKGHNEELENRILFYMPDKELHELTSLYFLYLLRKVGYQCLYLGVMTPLEAVRDAIFGWNPTHVIMSVSSELSFEKEVSEYLRQVAMSFPEQTIVVAGKLVDEITECGAQNVKMVNSKQELLELLA